MAKYFKDFHLSVWEAECVCVSICVFIYVCTEFANFADVCVCVCVGASSFTDAPGPVSSVQGCMEGSAKRDWFAHCEDQTPNDLEIDLGEADKLDAGFSLSLSLLLGLACVIDERWIDCIA